MKITILQTGNVPAPLRGRFGPYATMFPSMFGRVGAGLEFELADIAAGEALPVPEQPEGVIITGSPAGVYDETPWMEPLRQFIRRAYERRLPMLGICFGHQIMADALGGDVQKSEKGWGLGRHVYDVADHAGAYAFFGTHAAIAASHQDQVLSPPATAATWLSSDFTPHAGLIYENGAAISMQPHPEFDPAYSKALCDLRRNNPTDPETVEAAKQSLDQPLDNDKAARFFTGFFESSR